MARVPEMKASRPTVVPLGLSETIFHFHFFCLINDQSNFRGVTETGKLTCADGHKTAPLNLPLMSSHILICLRRRTGRRIVLDEREQYDGVKEISYDMYTCLGYVGKHVYIHAPVFVAHINHK